MELLSALASCISVIALAILPLPSSKGCIVTNHKCAIAAFITGSDSTLLNQLIKPLISFCITFEGGASKCTFSLPIAPETTCIGSSSVLSRHLPTTILCIPTLPVGNNAACQSNNLSSDNGWL